MERKEKPRVIEWTHKDFKDEPGKLVTIIGGAHQGKSYFVKRHIQPENVPAFVYDFQNSYGPTSQKDGDLILNLPFGVKDHRCRFMGTPETFTQHALKRRGTNIIFEEATIFLEGRTATEMRELMVNRYHHKNNIWFIFHSINAVNPRIMEFSDIIVLFKTGDSETIVKRKAPKLLPAFQKLQKMPNRSIAVIKNI